MPAVLADLFVIRHALFRRRATATRGSLYVVGFSHCVPLESQGR